DCGRILRRSERYQFYTGRVHRNHEHTGVTLVLNGNQSVMRNEGGMSQRRAGRDDLRSADPYSLVALLHNMDAGLRTLMDRAIAVDRRMNDCVIEKEDPFLRLLVPRPGVRFVRCIEAGVCPERSKE